MCEKKGNAHAQLFIAPIGWGVSRAMICAMINRETPLTNTHTDAHDCAK